MRENSRLLSVAIQGMDVIVALGIFVSLHSLGTLGYWPIPHLPAIGNLLSWQIYFLLIFHISLHLTGVYERFRGARLSDKLLRLSQGMVLTAGLCFAGMFAFKVSVSRLFFVTLMFAVFFALALSRLIIFHYLSGIRRQGYNSRTILLIGSNGRLQRFIEHLHEHAEWGYRIAGIIDRPTNDHTKHLYGYPVLGTLDNLEALLRSQPVDEVFFCIPREWVADVPQYMAICEDIGVTIRVMVDFFDLPSSQVCLQDFGGMPLITYQSTPSNTFHLALKRALDISLSGALLILLSPLFAISALLISLTMPGPIFFSQKRVGLNGRRFRMWKFRSMVVDAEKRKTALAGVNEMDGPVFKIRSDPRVTPLGRLLRKFSIDELPQLWNVFRGDMSLVGPRPPIPKEVSQYKRWQLRRLSMRPGITCIWQVSGRNQISFDQWMRMDLEYIDNWSFWNDLKILFKTVPVVLLAKGAS